MSAFFCVAALAIMVACRVILAVLGMIDLRSVFSRLPRKERHVFAAARAVRAPHYPVDHSQVRKPQAVGRTLDERLP